MPYVVIFCYQFLFFLNDTSTTEIYTLSLHDALPIFTTLGNIYKPFREVSWKPGVWFCSAVIVAAWGYFLYAGVTDPLGGINQLFPLFGIANQLLAAVALTLCTVLLIKAGKLKWAWVTGTPLVWDAAVTLTASWQKVFSGDPKLGFFSQRERYANALDQGQEIARHATLAD